MPIAGQAVSEADPLAPFRPGEDGAFDRLRAGHLLNRAGFGGTTDEIALMQELGIDAAVDLLLDFPDASASEMSQTDVPDASMLDGIPRRDVDRREAMMAIEQGLQGEEVRTQRQLLHQRWTRASLQHVGSCQAWWVRRMADGPYPLQEKLTLFWAGHFTSSVRDDREGSWRLWNQNETLRRYAAGNFVELVGHISRDPAMLKYLNNDRNVARSPNENLRPRAHGAVHAGRRQLQRKRHQERRPLLYRVEPRRGTLRLPRQPARQRQQNRLRQNRQLRRRRSRSSPRHAPGLWAVHRWPALPVLRGQ